MVCGCERMGKEQDEKMKKKEVEKKVLDEEKDTAYLSFFFFLSPLFLFPFSKADEANDNVDYALADVAFSMM